MMACTSATVVLASLLMCRTWRMRRQFEEHDGNEERTVAEHADRQYFHFTGNERA